ncbi:MAG: hypothetical protein IKX22_10635 [Prevotella sp.]|nr:hypothetical protein [Prevotella sp.]
MKHWIRLLCLSLLSIVVGAASAQNVAKVGTTEYATLQEAVDAAYNGMTGDITVSLLSDITANTIVRQKSGLNLTIDGENKTITGQILIDGVGNYGSDVLIIKNIKFSGSQSDFVSGKDAFIAVPNPKTLPSPYTANRLSDGHNITISNCTFTSTSSSFDVVGFKSESSANVKGLTISNCTGTNLHSLAQLTGTTNATFDGCTANSSGSFIGVNGGGGNYAISNCSFPSSKDGGYAIRVKSNFGEGSDNANITLTNNNLTATDVIQLGNVSKASVKINSGTYKGAVSNTGPATLSIASGTTFSQPVDDFLSEGFISSANGDGTFTVKEGTYVAKIGDVKYDNLQTAFDAAQDGETVTLLKDVDATSAMYSGDSRFNLWVKEGITVDGDGLTLTVKGRGIGVQGASSNIDVTFKDITVKNVGNVNGRCIDTRGKLNSLTLENATVTTAESSYTGYLQPLTIGGNQSATTTVNITNSNIIVVPNADKGYAITTFNPVNMTIDGSTLKGWACLNIKAADSSAGSNGSVFNVTNSELTSKNVYSGESNAYSVIKIEDVDVTVNVTNTAINVVGENNRQAIVGFEPGNTNGSVVNLGEGNNVTFTGTTDFAHNDDAASNLLISGGTFNQPVPEQNCAEGYIPTDLGNGKYSVKEGSYVAQIGTTKYETIAAAVAAATEGQTVEVIAAGEYTLPNLPNNVTIEGSVDGVVFNHTSSGSVASIPNGATFKNVAFNFGNFDYHGFQHAGTINMEGCTLNGKFFSYGDMNFTDCSFNQSNSDYHMWAYSGNLTYTDCTFTNEKTGKFINVYNESGATKYTVTATNCKFVNQGDSKKAALNVKATCGSKLLVYDVIINNCTTEGAFPEASTSDALVVLNSVAQVDDRPSSGVDNITVTQDGVLIYPAAVAKIGDVSYPTLQAALDAAHEMTGDVTVELLEDIDTYSIVHQKDGLNLTIDGADKTLAGQIFIDGNGRAGGTETLTIKNIKFEGNTSNFYSGTDAFILVPSTKDTDKPWTTGAYNYAHNITVTDCSFTSTSTSNKYDVVCYKSTSGAGEYNVTINNCTASGTMMHSLAQLIGTTGGSITNNTVTGSESFVNVNGGTGDFTISGNTFTSDENATEGYGIRENGTSTAVITLTDNTFTAANAVLLGKTTAVTAGTINVESGIYNGAISKTEAATGKIVVSGGYFSEEVAQDYIIEGKVCVSATDKPGYFTIGDPHYVAQIGETKYVSLQSALDAAHNMTGDVTIELLDDISSYSIVHQKAGLNLAIDGKEKTVNGQIIIDGDGRASGTETLTIQNIKFEGKGTDFYTGTDAFILVPSTKTEGTPYYTNKYNYAHNITINNCSLTSTDEDYSKVVGFKSTSGATCYNLVISNVTGSNLHSLAQLTATEGATFEDCSATQTGSFIGINGGSGSDRAYTITGCSFESHPDKTDGYAIRQKSSSTIPLTLSNNNFKAFDAIILGSNATITVESGTYIGNVSKTAGTIVISGGQFSADLTDTSYEPFIAEGKIGVQNNAVEGAPYSVEEGSYVALITRGESTHKYGSLEAAFAAAQDGETITLLADCSGNGIKVPESKYTTGLTVDFGGFTYNVTGNLVGSTGTETQGFQLLKDNKITFKNGTITSTKAKILVQNYSDLTLEGMKLMLNNADYIYAYTLSNNNGNVVIDGTTITANPAGGFAFDVCRYSSYPSVSVTVKGESVINGDVEVSASGSDAKEGFTLMLESGTISGNIVVDASAGAAMTATPTKAIIKENDSFNQDAPVGYMWVSDGEGTGTSTLAPRPYVAQIGDVKYWSLADAVAAVPADGTEATITMIADETIVGNAGVTIPVGKNIILDLNGKTVTLSVTESKGSQLITNRGTLTITDSSEGQNGKLTNVADESLAVGSWPTNNYVTNVITNSGTLNMEAGNIISTANGSICYAIDNNNTSYDAILNINGGYLTSVGTVIRQFCNSTTKQNVINMTGGVVTTNGYAAIWTQLPGEDASSKKLATLNISGGEITASSYAWYDYSYGDSFEAVEYNISGGKFTGGIYSYAIKNGVIDGFISGGLFSKAPSSSYIKTPGYMFGPSEEVEGYYELVLAEVDYSWTQNGKDYHDYLAFNTPFKKNYLMDGETITLLQNITLTEDLTWNTEGDATFTLNLGEFKITKGNFSVKLSPGQAVNASKSAAIFTTDEEGYYVKSTKNADETYTYTVEEADLMYTAANGKVSYLAWSNTVISGGGTYKLLKDVTASARIVPGTMATNVTLDLNGHTLTSTATDYAVLLSRNGTTSSHKTFALVDTSTEGGGKLIVNADADAAIQATGKFNDVTIGEGVTIEGGCVAMLSENQTLIVNGTINGGNDFAVATNGSSTKNTTITINEGAVLTSDVTAMYLPGNEGVETTINGGAITGGDTGIEIRAGKLVVNGGNITSTATEYSSVANGNGTTTKGAAIAVVQHTTQLPIDVEVLGGSLSGLYNIAVSDVQNGSLTDDVEVTVKDELLGETILPTDYKWVSNGDGTSSLGLKEYVAQIEGGAKFETLEAAFAAAQDGETITLLANCSGNGIKVPEGKYTTGLTVNFNDFTYDVTGNLVGSTGTESQGFQLLKDNKITFKNGTVKSTDNAIFLIQNYSDLTLEGMTLTLSHSSRSDCYTLSNNNGNVVIDGTTINANEGGSFAFDVCRYSSYPSVSVTVTGESVINGDVEISASGNDAKNGFNLMLDSGTINGDLVIDPSAAAAMEATPEKAVIREKDSFGQAAPADFKWVSDGEGTGTSTLKACEYIAAIGTTKYETLQEAVNAAGTAETTITLLTEAATNGVISGDGVVVPSGSNITFDLNGLTYDVAGETVGSTGTESNGFQLLQGSDITFKNGTLKATSPTAQMLIQNYSNLTLEDVNLDGTTLSGWAYALSNNCGTINLTGSTSITAKTGGRAFDTCKYADYAIPTVNINTTGAITGPIEATGGKLNIKNGKFDVTWVTDNNYTAGDIQITGGIFSEEPDEEYCAEGYVATDNEDEETKAAYPYAVMTKEDAGIYDLYDLLAKANSVMPRDDNKTPYTLEEDTPVKVVTYYREFSETTANTRQCWFVPFDYTLTAEDLEKCTFYRIHMFSAPANQEGVVEDEKDVVMKISELTAEYTLKANKPYIIKPKASGVYEFVAENTTLKAKNTDELLSLATSIYEYDFYGVYDSYGPMAANQWFSLNTNGNLKWNSATQKLGPYRWYIKPTFTGDDYANISFIIDEEGEGDETTTIDQIFYDPNAEIEGFYTVGGVKLDKPVRGLNIVKYTDGRTKKVYVK